MNVYLRTHCMCADLPLGAIIIFLREIATYYLKQKQEYKYKQKKFNKGFFFYVTNRSDTNLTFYHI